jgi:hypothetical protein
MSETPQPADLLEFLGSIDEDNDESQDGDFSDFLAKADIDKIAADEKPKPKVPPPDDDHE